MARRGCWACRAKENGVKSRKSFNHTCGKSPSREARLPTHTITRILSGMGKLDLLVELSISTFVETFVYEMGPNMDEYIKEKFSSDALGHELCDNNNIFLLVECDGIPSGYAKLRKHTNCPEMPGQESIELERIYIMSEYQGYKIGFSLMMRCVMQAITEGYRALWLGVNEKNDIAIKFYEKFGFKKIGTHQFKFGKDLQEDWLMEKKFV